MFPHPVTVEVEVGIPKPKNAVIWVVTIASYRGAIEHPKLCCNGAVFVRQFMYKYVYIYIHILYTKEKVDGTVTMYWFYISPG